MVVFVLFYSASFGAVMWVLVPEILPAKGVSIATGIDWVGTVVVSLVYKPLADLLGNATVFYIFAGGCLTVYPHSHNRNRW